MLKEKVFFLSSKWRKVHSLDRCTRGRGDNRGDNRGITGGIRGRVVKQDPRGNKTCKLKCLNFHLWNIFQHHCPYQEFWKIKSRNPLLNFRPVCIYASHDLQQLSEILIKIAAGIFALILIDKFLLKQKEMKKVQIIFLQEGTEKWKLVNFLYY